jgi:hypothetical protein
VADPVVVTVTVPDFPVISQVGIAGLQGPAGATGGVTSVNGEDGVVVLDATDVGAYPDDNPSNFIDAAGAPVQSVNGEIGTVVLDADDVGAIGTAVGLYVFDYGTAIPDFRPSAAAVYFRGTAEPGTAISEAGDLWYDADGGS